MSKQKLTIDGLDNRFHTIPLYGTVYCEEESGTAFIVNEDTECCLNLPPAKCGLNYSLYVSVNMTHDLTLVANGDLWRVNLRYVDKDVTGASSFAGGSTTEGYVHYVGCSNYVADKDNKGRLDGTLLELRCYVDGEWYMSGLIIGNGAVGSPFVV